jgi:hypothetical protein
MGSCPSGLPIDSENSNPHGNAYERERERERERETVQKESGVANHHEKIQVTKKTVKLS